MATGSSSIYGLLNPKKGGLSLQTIGTPLDEQTDENQTGLPTSPFASLPQASLGGNSFASPEVQAIQNANIPSNFQFTGEYDARNRGLLQQETDAGFSRKNTLAQLAEQYQQAIRQAEQQQTKGRKSLFASLADKGALGSGAALENVSEYDTNYNDYLNNLSRGRASDMANAENSYASVLNQLGRQREGLVSEQQQAEEARRLQEEQLKAEAERQRVQEEQRRGDIQKMLEQQQQAIAAANAAAQAATRSSYSNGFSGGGGGGGGYSPPQQAYQPPPPQAPQDWVKAPNLAQGSTMASFGNWVHNNLDQYASPEAIKQVLNVFNSNGGASMTDLAWLIRQYPNASQPTNDRTTYGGRFQ